MISLKTSLTPHTEQALEIYQHYMSQGITAQVVRMFQEAIYDYYYKNKRSFAWREEISPYRVVVSEIMLQQTQTHRVVEKFTEFTTLFPDFLTLAQAPFEDVLRAWKGLGYNRRAINLQALATKIIHEYRGILPTSPEELVTFKGIGAATASSICAFAYNSPTVFIETNIRTVFIYFFYHNNIDKPIDDKQLMVLIKACVDQESPREWYYALMDYGVMLKKTVGNLCKLSKQYTKQSKFIGSDREIRGQILQVLLEHKNLPKNDLSLYIKASFERIMPILEQLINEGFITSSGDKLNIY